MEKRILALLLSGCLIFSSISFSVQAEELGFLVPIASENFAEEDYDETVSDGDYTESDQAEIDETVSSGDATGTVLPEDSEGTDLSGGAEETESTDTNSDLDQWVKVTVVDVDLPDNDTLFTGYLQQQMYAELYGGISTYGNYGETALIGKSDFAKNLYTFLKGKIGEVASGDIRSTKFTFSASELGIKLEWTAKELEVEALLNSAGNALSSEADAALDSKAFSELADHGFVMHLLLVDCPYELYWFDKTIEHGFDEFGYSLTYNKERDSIILENVELTYHMPVAVEYREDVDDKYEMKHDAQLIQKALDTASGILTENKGKPDYEKLMNYCTKIRDLTEYNYDAAAGKYPYSYGDPWQLIWVFDGDPETKVVCEGYSKAFQYLCDLTAFGDDIICYTVTGNMIGGTGEGPHMWNIVTMEDDKNYLVDVTNASIDRIDLGNSLFLAGYYKAVNGGYTFLRGTQEITYIYDANDKSNMPEMYGDILNINDSDYEHKESIADVATVQFTNGSEEFVYNGNEHTPAVTVAPKSGDIVLVSGTDYTISYENNRDAGTATVIVSGIGKYSGKLTPLEFEIKQKPVTAVVKAADKIYDGTTKADITVTFPADGLIAGDNLTITGVTGSFADKNAGENKTVTIDTTHAKVTGEGAGNYEITYPNSVLQASISQKTLKLTDLGITVDNTKVYDGKDEAVVNVGSTWLNAPDNLVKGKDYEISGKYEVDANVGTGKTVTVTVVLQNTDVAKNYKLEENSLEFTASITAAPLKITADGNTIVYGDEPKPGDKGVVYEGFVNNESKNVLQGVLTFTYTDADANEYKQYGNVGEYIITPGGLTSNNYAIEFCAGKLIVTQKEVTLEWQNIVDRYLGDGKEVTAKASGLVNNDIVSVTVVDEGKNAGAAGEYKATATGLTGEKAGNYSLPGNKEIVYQIEENASNISIKTYKDGIESSEFTYGDVITVKASLKDDDQGNVPGTMTLYIGETAISDPAIATAEGEFIMTYDTAGKEIPVGQQALTVKYTASDATEEDGHVFVLVNAKELTPVLSGTVSKVYDGSTAVTTEGLNVTLSGLLSGDKVEPTWNLQDFQYEDKNAENNKTVTGLVKLAGEDVEWYTLTNEKVFTSGNSITPLALTVTLDPKEKIYGDSDPEWTYQAPGLLPGDTLNVEFNRESGETVGTYAISAIVSNANYSITVNNDSVLTIKPRPVVLVWQADTELVYNGDTQTVTAVVDNKVGSDTVNVSAYNGNRSGVNAGSYTAIATGLTGADSSNYTLDGAATSYTWEIKRRPVELQWEGDMEVYDGKTHSITATVGNAVGEDDVNVSSYETGSNSAVNAGEYSAKVTGLDGDDSSNYTLDGAVNNPYTWSILPKDIADAEVVLDEEEFVYDGKPHTINVTSVTLAGFDKVTYEVSGNSATNAGTYVLTIKGTGNFTGEVTKEWSIASVNLAGWDTSGLSADKYWDGNKSVQLIGKLGLKGVLGSDDPELTYSLKVIGEYASADAGEYKLNLIIIIEEAALGNGNYTLPDERELQLTITGRIVKADIVKDAVVSTPDGDVLRLVQDNDFQIISQELKDNGYNAEKIESALRSKLTEKAGYTDANYVTYDLSLQISLDGGKTWVNVTEENFPEKGVTVLLAYPEGTGKDTHDFIVTHMLSRPYGIYPAGHIEELPVTETSEGIQVTLYSLSPIGIAWKLEEVGDNTEPGNQKPDGSGTQTSTDTSAAAGALAADTQNLPKSPLTGDDYEVNTFLEMAGRIAKCASVLMLVVGVVGELVLYRRKRSRSDDRNLQ